jgi:hypothetical protein
VHTADGVVVGDGAAGVEHRFGCGVLDLGPHRDLGSLPPLSRPRVVRRRPVGIDVREAAAEQRLVAEHLAQRGRHPLAHDPVELGPSIPRDGGLERVGDQPEARLHAVAHADERVAPRADGALAAGGLLGVGDPDVVVVDPAAALAGQVDRVRDRIALAELGRLERDDHQRLGAVEGRRPRRLGRVEDAQVRGPQLGLHDAADGLVALFPRVEHHAGGGPVGRTPLDAHPRLGDDPEDPLAADHQAIGRRARPRSG